MTKHHKNTLIETVELLLQEEMDEKISRFNMRFSTTASCLEVVLEDPDDDSDLQVSWAFSELLPKDKAQRSACIALIRYVLDEESEQ